MRKRFMNISKRCMVAIMSAAFIMSSVTVSMAFPVGVYAENNSENGVTLDHDIDTNTGTGVILNEGKTIYINQGTVTTNNGTVTNNFPGATVTTNNGTVSYNGGTVTTNNGTVTNNSDGATVTTNNGTVSFNMGTVTDNFGTVTENRGTVVNNFDGQVEGPVTNQYWTVVVDAENADVAFGDDITTKTVGDIDRHYIKDGQSGTITLTPAGDFEINGNTGEELNGTDPETNTAFTYSAGKDANGVWTITILNMPSSLYLNPACLNLMISGITGEENPKANVIVSSGESSGDDGDQNPPSDETNNNISNASNPVADKVNSATTTTWQGSSVLMLDFKNQTNFTGDDLRAIVFTRPDMPKICICTDPNTGIMYYLYIPVSKMWDSASVNDLFAMISALGSHCAGYEFIAMIGANLGFRCAETDVDKLLVYNPNKIQNIIPDEPMLAVDMAQMQTANTTQNMDSEAIASQNMPYAADTTKDLPKAEELNRIKSQYYELMEQYRSDKVNDSQIAQDKLKAAKEELQEIENSQNAENGLNTPEYNQRIHETAQILIDHMGNAVLSNDGANMVMEDGTSVSTTALAYADTASVKSAYINSHAMADIYLTALSIQLKNVSLDDALGEASACVEALRDGLNNDIPDGLTDSQREKYVEVYVLVYKRYIQVGSPNKWALEKAKDSALEVLNTTNNIDD